MTTDLRKRSRVLYATNTFMQVLLGGVFAFFALHTALWFPRSWRERRRVRSAAAPPVDSKKP